MDIDDELPLSRVFPMTLLANELLPSYFLGIALYHSIVLRTLGIIDPQSGRIKKRTQTSNHLHHRYHHPSAPHFLK